MENLKPNAQRAQDTITLLWLMVILEVVSLVSGYFHYKFLKSITLFGILSMEIARANDTREILVALVYLMVYIMCIVKFIQWFRRAYHNLHMKVNNLTYSEDMAATSWFIPFFHLVAPFQIMQELYTETKALLFKKGVAMHYAVTTNNLVWWWFFWIITNLIGNYVFIHSFMAENVDDMISVYIVSMFGNILGIPLTLITINVVRDYSYLERQLGEIKDEE